MGTRGQEQEQEQSVDNVATSSCQRLSTLLPSCSEMTCRAAGLADMEVRATCSLLSAAAAATSWTSTDTTRVSYELRNSGGGCTYHGHEALVFPHWLMRPRSGINDRSAIFSPVECLSQLAQVDLTQLIRLCSLWSFWLMVPGVVRIESVLLQSGAVTGDCVHSLSTGKCKEDLQQIPTTCTGRSARFELRQNGSNRCTVNGHLIVPSLCDGVAKRVGLQITCATVRWALRRRTMATTPRRAATSGFRTAIRHCLTRNL